VFLLKLIPELELTCTLAMQPVVLGATPNARWGRSQGVSALGAGRRRTLFSAFHLPLRSKVPICFGLVLNTLKRN
jgi:hypothetical protein